MRLVSARSQNIQEDETRATDLLAKPPQTLDALGTYAYFDRATNAVIAAGGAPKGHEILKLTAADDVRDLALGHDGRA